MAAPTSKMLSRLAFPLCNPLRVFVRYQATSTFVNNANKVYFGKPPKPTKPVQRMAAKGLDDNSSPQAVLSYVENKIAQKIPPSTRLILIATDNAKEPEDAERLKQILMKFRTLNAAINHATAKEVLTAFIRVNVTDEAIDLLTQPRLYGITPDMNLINSLLLRLGSEVKEDPQRFFKVLSLWNYVQTSPFLEPDLVTYYVLLRASVIAKSPELVPFTSKLISSSIYKENVTKDAHLQFWTRLLLFNMKQSPDLYRDVSEPIYNQLSQLQQSMSKEFPQKLVELLAK